MPFLTTRRVLSRIFPDPERSPDRGVRDVPEKIVLGVREGVAASGKPPVRIFLGTEAGQHRAERVFVYSIEKVRDPSRVYEIHLMKDVRGYDRRWWLTGFTNYRFAIAYWAGSTGRAIYNDVDQVFLADPAPLFDADMGGKGFLAITPDDTAVMLIDCERMAKVWTPELVKHGHRKQIEKRSRAEWGGLESCWHARDFDYVAGYSKCLHFTTIHEQPWHPFPNLFVYMPSPVYDIWHDLEREADRADFSVFDFTSPGSLYTELVSELRSARRRGPLDLGAAAPPQAGLGELLAQGKARSVLEFVVGGPRDEAIENRVGKFPGATQTTFDPTATAAADMPVPPGPFDVVVATAGFELLSDEDVPWVLDELFRRARSAVFVTVDDIARTIDLTNGRKLRVSRRGFAWWRAVMEASSRLRPELRWRIGVRRRAFAGTETVEWREGGRRLDQTPPNVWILADPKPGHTTQSIGLAEALGWPYQIKDAGFPTWTKVTDRLLGPYALDPGGHRTRTLAPPWPDLVISTGWSTVPVAKAIAKRGNGRTTVVQMGRKGGEISPSVDLVATCSYVRYPPNQRRVEIAAPINQVTPKRLRDAQAKFAHLFDDLAAPRIVVLVGGLCSQYELGGDVGERLGRDVAAMTRKAGGSVVAVTSRRTPEETIVALERAVAGIGKVHRWRADEKENPYLGYLAGADAIVVTGESESMIAEACSTGKPVTIYPVPKKPLHLGQRLVQLVTDTAYSKPRKRKGTFRPQQGTEYFCSRLIERGIVHPARDLEAFHRSLVERGHARIFDGTLELEPPVALREAEVVADRVRALLGCTKTAPSPEVPPEALPKRVSHG